MAQLEAMVVANLPTIPSIPNPQSYLDALQAKIPANLCFNFTIPGFPAIPALPSPLLPDINFPEFDFHVGLGNMLTNLSTYSLQQCVNFCENTIGQLGFSFPTICVPFTPSI
jgi:hypothetical protein